MAGFLKTGRVLCLGGWLCLGGGFAAGGVWAAPDHDLVIQGGRVMDPETGTDRVADVAINGGKIAAISDKPLAGRRVIDARGLVVAPGFIDLHAHGQQLPAARVQAFDGVTTALELEAGLLPVRDFYDKVAKEGRPINYGTAVSWTTARIAVMEGLKPRADLQFFRDAAGKPNWTEKIADDRQRAAILALVEQGLRDGAIGVGVLLGYAPASGRKEFYEVNKLAASYGAPTFTHVRYMSMREPASSFEAYEEMVAVAASTGAHMHICHLNSTSLRDIDKAIELIGAAQKRGVRLSVEAYPYGAASTNVGAALFRGANWRERMGHVTAGNFEFRGVTLTEPQLAHMQANTPGAVIVFNFLDLANNPDDQAVLDRSVLYPGGAIASDGGEWVVDGKPLEGEVWPLPETAFAHPRSAGTFSRFLRDYVRERQKISLMEAIRKMTLIPARILEDAVPQMKQKGRLRPGADADVVVFDATRISDRATFTEPAQTSVGVRHLIVNGVPVIAEGVLDRAARPGQPIRRPVTAP